MRDAGAAIGQEQRYAEAAAAVGPALERLARAYERDPDKRRDPLQEIHVALGIAGWNAYPARKFQKEIAALDRLQTALRSRWHP